MKTKILGMGERRASSDSVRSQSFAPSTKRRASAEEIQTMLTASTDSLNADEGASFRKEIQELLASTTQDICARHLASTANLKATISQLEGMVAFQRQQLQTAETPDSIGGRRGSFDSVQHQVSALPGEAETTATEDTPETPDKDSTDPSKGAQEEADDLTMADPVARALSTSVWPSEWALANTTQLAERFDVNKFWGQAPVSKKDASERGAALMARKSHQAAGSLLREEETEEDRQKPLLERMTISGNAGWRTSWDLFACVLMLTDCIFIPLQLMSMEDNLPLTILGWFARVFWTIDIFLNIVTSAPTEPDGKSEIPQIKTAINYLKSWFIIDSGVCILDWLDAFLSIDVSAARIGKTIKGFRLLKMARLLRILKSSRMPDFTSNLTYYFRSDFFVSLIGIFRIMAIVFFLCHITACFWYRIAVEHHDDQNWLVADGYDGYDLSSAYVIAFHWALTQFSGTMEVYPRNDVERVFALTVLFFTFFGASWVISVITASMTKLELLTVQRSAKMATLKQFLYDNNISRRLAIRVQRSAQHATKELERNTTESSVELLRIIPEPLRKEIHFERHMPVLSKHPLFSHLGEVFEAAATDICHTCINVTPIMSGEIIFSPGTEAQHMYFMAKGKATYVTDDGFVDWVEGQWLCEGSMWTKWCHIGLLFAPADCTLIKIDCSACQKVFSENEDNEAARTFLGFYANRFVKYLNSLEPEEINDSILGEFDYEKAVKDCAGETYVMHQQASRANQTRKGKRRAKGTLFSGAS